MLTIDLEAIEALLQKRSNMSNVNILDNALEQCRLTQGSMVMEL